MQGNNGKRDVGIGFNRGNPLSFEPPTLQRVADRTGTWYPESHDHYSVAAPRTPADVDSRQSKHDMADVLLQHW
jgi:hypothetical protein